MQIRCGDEEWFDEQRATLLEYRQRLDLRRGMLLRTIRFEQAGRRSVMRERRLVSMHDKHLAALEISLTPENWSGPITIRSGLDGRVVNAGAQLYRPFNNRHLAPVASASVGQTGVSLLVRTSQSRLYTGSKWLERPVRTSMDAQPRPLDLPFEKDRKSHGRGAAQLDDL